MNKEQTNQLSSIRKKLMAALAMLLVACIMTVSSTYAWFTLSTAPEVRGITTTVGANGNLEIALGTYDTFYGTDDPSSNVGDSFDNSGDYTLANVAWGNLVDLSDESYGLRTISLFPARLNANGNALNRTSPLQFPKYGSDGRVNVLSDKTLVGEFDSNSFGFLNQPGANHAGVSGIGSASTMSERAFAVQNNKVAINTYKNAATNAAKDAIREYAGTLAAIALEYQNAEPTAVVSEADIAVLRNLIAKLVVSNTAISDSMKAGVQVSLAAANTLNETQWKAAVSLGKDKDIAEYVAALQEAADTQGVTLPAQVTNQVAKYTAIDAKLDAANAALPATGDGTWGDIEESVSNLLVASGIKIGGYTIQEVKADYAANGMGGDVVTDLFSKMSNNTLSYTFTATSGIFADIAAMTDKYESSMAFPKGTEVEGLDLSLLGGKTVYVEGPDAGVLATVKSAMDGAQAPDADPTAAVPLTDTYGYIVDLLFRTNASDSHLQLQTNPKDRIYSDNAKDATTQGGGSNMTFTITAEYTRDLIEKLAAHIRVVFFNNTNQILAVATLDVDNGVVSGDDYKMNLYLTEYTIGANGAMATGAFKSDSKLCALTAGVKTGLSALVYLDGEAITNADVGVSTGLTSKLNLQFSSSASLTPMEYNDLHVPGTTTTTAGA